MFDSYHYFSSFSTTMVADMGTLARRLTTDLGLGPDQLVVEVASNDGYLLSHYVDLGVPVLGIDPAANVAKVANERGVPTLVEYFGLETASRLRAEGRRADVLHANNVMAHVPDINDFVAGIATLLADDGVAIIETPYLVDLITSVEFDTIYHEHVFYYSLQAVSTLAARHGLVVADVERLPIHGGSLRIHLRHAAAAQPSAAAVALLEQEADLAVGTPGFYAGFVERVEELKQATLALVRQLRADGSRLAAYGAAAKGTVLLNHFGIDRDLIDFVVDKNHHKHGLLMPGVAIPIADPGRLLLDRPDHVLLLAWNFADEIIGEQAEYLAAGGAFIVPIPELRVVER
jgi:SAM-dependent methyltransferase